MFFFTRSSPDHSQRRKCNSACRKCTKKHTFDRFKTFPDLNQFRYFRNTLDTMFSSQRLQEGGARAPQLFHWENSDARAHLFRMRISPSLICSSQKTKCDITDITSGLMPQQEVDSCELSISKPFCQISLKPFMFWMPKLENTWNVNYCNYIPEEGAAVSPFKTFSFSLLYYMYLINLHFAPIITTMTIINISTQYYYHCVHFIYTKKLQVGMLNIYRFIIQKFLYKWNTFFWGNILWKEFHNLSTFVNQILAKIPLWVFCCLIEVNIQRMCMFTCNCYLFKHWEIYIVLIFHKL